MGFQTGWTEMMHWLEKSVLYLEDVHRNAITSYEREQLGVKLRSMRMVLEKMYELERIYELCIHEDAIIDSKFDTREMYCPRCNKRLYDCRL
jgi:hypothetical protein